MKKLFVLLSFSCTLGFGQKSDFPYSSEPYQSANHFALRYVDAKYEYAFKGTTQKDFIKWKNDFLPVLKGQLGLNMLEKQYKNYKPKALKRTSEDMGTYTRERWYLWTEPTVPLPFVVLIPKNKAGKLPLILTPHGHSKNTEMYVGIYNTEEEKRKLEDGDRDIAVQAVNEGYIAIAPTARGFGETRVEDDLKNDKLSSCRTLLMHDLLIGSTPIGDRVWDISRLIDWAAANLPIDEKRIAITGNSGGGTVSLFAAACEPRISVAVPASYFCTFKGSIGSIPHCECNYVPGMLNMGEMYDVAGLIAPRPFCAIHGKSDLIFPIAETQYAFQQLQKVYAAAGVPDYCELFIGEGGHRYYKNGSWVFIKKHFDKIK